MALPYHRHYPHQRQGYRRYHHLGRPRLKCRRCHHRGQPSDVKIKSIDEFPLCRDK